MKTVSQGSQFIDGIITILSIFTFGLGILILAYPSFNMPAAQQWIASLMFPNSSDIDHVVTMPELVGIALTVLSVIALIVAFGLATRALGILTNRMFKKCNYTWTSRFWFLAGLIMTSFLALSIATIAVRASVTVLFVGSVMSLIASLLLALSTSKRRAGYPAPEIIAD